MNASPADKVAFAEAELMLTVEQVALRKMRAQRHGWVCALWVQKQLRVFLAHDLDGVAGGCKEGWIEEVVAGGARTTSRKHAWLAFNNFGLPLNLIIISLRTLIPVES